MASQRPTLLGVAPQRRKEAFGLSRMFGAYGQISPVAADRRHAVGRVNIGFNMSDASMAKHAIQCNRHGLHPKKSLGEATFRQLSQRTYPRNHTRERSAARHLPTSRRQHQNDGVIMKTNFPTDNSKIPNQARANCQFVKPLRLEINSATHAPLGKGDEGHCEDVVCAAGEQLPMPPRGPAALKAPTRPTAGGAGTPPPVYSHLVTCDWVYI